uniref:Uncharacterized protein n=1 Tax=Arundo donax TaxID=35708 RepID=A0A0A9FHN3_ARUDO
MRLQGTLSLPANEIQVAATAP